MLQASNCLFNGGLTPPSGGLFSASRDDQLLEDRQRVAIVSAEGAWLETKHESCSQVGCGWRLLAVLLGRILTTSCVCVWSVNYRWHLSHGVWKLCKRMSHTIWWDSIWRSWLIGSLWSDFVQFDHKNEVSPKGAKAAVVNRCLGPGCGTQKSAWCPVSGLQARIDRMTDVWSVWT